MKIVRATAYRMAFGGFGVSPTETVVLDRTYEFQTDSWSVAQAEGQRLIKQDADFGDWNGARHYWIRLDGYE